ncbi:hypothetical protein RHGRI_028593 [Rhododendron griersonianum]|uniref:Protein kinase domain-containing protein n=1 Tax=Rhododendron griersonianum TaxID=479676 RepID=A0AAV6IJS8_9ERIC|nr:hypothetical protein RHGRI_028593 [Rhododendron griersonianum]
MSTCYALVLVLVPLFFFLPHILSITVKIPMPYAPVDNLAINCGSLGNSTTRDGRGWTGDIGSKFSQLQPGKSKSVTSKAFHQFSDAVHPVPYMTARISRSQFSYTLKVNPGQKFIRLHFHPVSYPGFERSNAIFTVKAGHYTLLSNFSASLTADALRLRSFVKEFCLNVGESRALTITFFPSPSTPSDAAYAFINGIEIVSMPTSLYYTQGNDPGPFVVGQSYRFYIENSTALETIQRSNVGGSSISSVEDSGMFREWSEDSNHLMYSSVVPISTTVPIKYTSIPTYIAPQKVYQTAWSVGPTKQPGQLYNFTWKVPIDLGFRYLIRLHFCELEYAIKDSGQREFCIIINEQIAEAYADIIEWSGGIGVAVYRDYVVKMEGDRMEGKRDLVIAIRPRCRGSRSKHAIFDPILNGVEVFKLSNLENNLAGPNPECLADSRTSKAPKTGKLPLSYKGVKVIVNGLIIVLTLLNIVVHQLYIWAENSGKKTTSKLSPKEICRRFSLAEMHLATNNFDDAFTIGCGGFGKVYKGIINKGATIVAIKQLNSASKQGAHEFWTEIKMLSQLQHTHLVALIGYCDECQEMMLVYEYMAHGTLADHIYKIRRNDNGISGLTWEKRLSISIGAARGLNYLHMDTNFRVIHRDVKSTNILLDENWVAKISDFGLSKMGNTSQSRSHVSTNVKGTFGYLDPEYFSTRRLTRKSDVYAFGVVLLEVLCGRPAVDIKLEEEQRSLALWAQHCIREGIVHQIIDPHLKTRILPNCLKLFVEVAMKCLHNYSKDRPTMDDVVRSLELALAAQESSISCTNEAISIDGGADNGQIFDADVQCLESPIYGLDNTPLSVKRTKLTITKLVQSMVVTFKGKDLQKKKAKDLGSDSPGGGSTWWWQWKPSTHSTKKPNGKRLPPLLEDLCRHLSLAEIQAATNNFDCKLSIEHGSIGRSYKGYIDNGRLAVVIRRYEPGSHEACQCWDNLEILAELRHINLLSPIGYCCDKGEMILVYNYLGNGSLHDHLFGMHTDPLPWKRRLEICIGIGQGLQHLHAGTRHAVVLSVRACNILLDHDWVPKVSSDLDTFYVLEPSSVSTIEAIVNEKFDVYSFGVVLVGVLSGLKAWSNNWPSEDYRIHCMDRKCIDPYFHIGEEYFKSCMDRKCIDHIIDPYLMGRIPPDCFREFVKLCWSCLLNQGIKRPSMADVVGRLQLVLQLLETSDDHIQFGGESEGYTIEMSHKEVVAQAYHNALFNDSEPFLIDSDWFDPNATQMSFPDPVNLYEMSCATLDDSDYCSSNLAR